MKSADDIKKSVKRLNMTAGPELHDRVLGSLLRTMEESTKQPSIRQEPNIWRIIVKSKTTKFAAAAVIIIGIMIGLNFLTGSPDGASIAFAEIADNMEKMPWMHGVVEGVGERLEAWFSFERKVVVSKRGSGEIRYHDGLKQVIWVFDPKTNTITISYTAEDALAGIGQSVLGFPKLILKFFDESGGKIIEETCKYKGKNSKIYRMSGVMGGMDIKVEMIVDMDKNIPLFINQKVFDKDGVVKVEANAYFDYPENGPDNIYEVGVPKSAKVVDNLPTEEIPQLLETYRLHRDNSPSRYIAVVTDEWFNQDTNASIIHNASIIYREGPTQRVEYYGVNRDKWEEYNKNWDKYKNEMGDTFESNFFWWTRNEMSLLSAVHLYAGISQYQLRFDNGKSLPRVCLPKGDELQANNTLADFGWDVDLLASSSDTHSGGLVIVENEYSKKNNLICIENKVQGRMTDLSGKVWAVPPSRRTYYLNPQQDYICQRFEREEMLDAPWQQDKEWLNRIKQENIDILNPLRNQVRQVTEFAQTEQGLWYPKEIKTWIPNTDKADKVIVQKIWLRTDLEFPKGIFDPELLR